MNRQIFIFYFIYIFIILQFQSCQYKSGDSFYTESCGYDCKRIPLIKPYSAMSTSGADGPWYVDCGSGGTEVVDIAVIDSLIIFYFYDKYIIDPAKRDTTWYIYIPSKRQELKFSSKIEFYNKISKSTNKQVNLIDVSELYKTLIDQGYLDWYPEEYKKKKS